MKFEIILIAFLSALALLPCTPLQASESTNPLKSSIEMKLAEVLQQEVVLGDCEFNATTATLKNIVVGKAKAQAGGKPLAEIDSLNIDYIPISLLTGNPLFKNLRFKGVRLNIGVDSEGRSTLRAFLAGLSKGSREGIPDLGTILLEDVTVSMHAPKKFVAPKSAYKIGPTSAHFKTLTVKPLPPEDRKEQDAGAHARIGDAWIEIEFEALKLQAALIGAPRALPTRAKGKRVAEGLKVAQGTAQIFWSENPHPILRLRKTRIEGIAGQSYLHAPAESETIVRIVRTLATNMTDASKQKKANAHTQNDLSIAIEDLIIKDSALEIAGPDAHGKIAYWRLSDLNVELSHIALGKIPANEAETEGHLQLESETLSSEGNGIVEIEWEQITGAYPKWSSNKSLNLKGLALPALSTRLGNKEEAGFVRGRMDLWLKGNSLDGILDLKGSLVVSTDTQLSRRWESTRSSQQLNKIATGRPLEPIKIRGSLTEPKFKAPGPVGEAFKGVGVGVQNAGRFLKDEVLSRIPLVGQVFRD